jgi:N-acetylneuraminic acid mutarotase
MSKTYPVIWCILLATILCTVETPNVIAAESLEENSWTVLPEQQKEDFLQCAAVDGKIYVLCANSDLNTVDIYIFDPQANTWTKKTSTTDQPMYGEVTSASYTTAVIDDRIYCFGHGIYREGIINNKVYSTSTNHWSSINSSPNSREKPSGCVVNGKIYLVGGQTYTGVSEVNPKLREMEPTSIVETYDPSTGVWETKQPMNKPVQFPRSVAVDDKIYVFGGGYVQVYDTQKDLWVTIVDQRGDQTLNGVAATTGKYAPQKIYVFGHSTIYLFDTKTLTFVGNISYPEFDSSQYPGKIFGNYSTSREAAVVIDDVFYLIGGGVIERDQLGSPIVSIGVDYRFVPLGYSVSSQSGGADDGSLLPFTLAGVAVAVAVLAVATVAILRFRHKSVKAAKHA